MNRPELYFNTTEILFSAFENETIFHNCWGVCAVANIIAANMGYTVNPYFVEIGLVGGSWKKGEEGISSCWWWKLLKWPKWLYQKSIRLKMGEKKYRLQEKHISSTGYSLKELKKIMKAFDSAFDGIGDRQNVLAGINNVLMVLKKIHKVNSADLKGNYRSNFILENKMVTKTLLKNYYPFAAVQIDPYYRPQESLTRKRVPANLSVELV